MPDDILEIKPGAYGIKLNVRALIRWITKKAKQDPIAAVAQRFLHLFTEHGVPVSQIPRVLPCITLKNLRSPDTLIPALNGDVLDQAASLFRVRRPWIENASDSVYDCLWCYKAPEQFVEDIAAMNTKSVLFPIRALFCSKRLEMTNPLEQPIALLLLEKVADLDGEEVFRYRIYGDGWDWAYWKSRIQLKAMARLVDKQLCQRIPLYHTDKKTLEEIRSGTRIPPISTLRRPSNDQSLEDFGLSPQESRCAKETEELPSVLEYIKNNDLEACVKNQLNPKRRRIK